MKNRPANETAMKILVLVLDLGGTFVFALSGAMAAVRQVAWISSAFSCCRLRQPTSVGSPAMC